MPEPETGNLMTARDPTLILDWASWETTLRQRAERARNDVAPVRWNGLLDRLVEGRVKRASKALPWQRGIHISPHLFPTTILAALFRRPLVYLCWGNAYHRGVRREIVRMILRRARLVLVNEDRTRDEVRSMAGSEPRKIPYLVDTDFYPCAPTGERADFLFCPGDNDRDGEMLVALAERGHRVVWLNNVPEFAARFAGRSDRLELVSAVSFAELRDLYRRCRAVVTPLTRDVHAAGQTTTLEALASGCAVVLGAGRTAELFAGDGLVTVVAKNDPAAWEAAIESTVTFDKLKPWAPAERSALIAKRHGVAAVTAVMHDVLESVVKSTRR